jgi:hypothetical protein
MPAKRIGYRDFVDDTRRAVFQDENGQFVLDDDKRRLYGVWLLPDAPEVAPMTKPEDVRR